MNSLRDAVDLYEGTAKEKKEVEEVETVVALSVPEVFERMLESKLRQDIGESEERKMLSEFLSRL